MIPNDAETSMNVEKINELADFIEQRTDLEFDQREAGNPTCGSAGCIAGFLIAMEGSKFNRASCVDLAEMLCLKQDQARALYYADTFDGGVFYGGEYDFAHITRSQAAKTLRHLAEAGDVRWDV